MSRLKNSITPSTSLPRRIGSANAREGRRGPPPRARGKFASPTTSGIHAGRPESQTRPGSPTPRANLVVRLISTNSVTCSDRGVPRPDAAQLLAALDRPPRARRIPSRATRTPRPACAARPRPASPIRRAPARSRARSPAFSPCLPFAFGSSPSLRSVALRHYTTAIHSRVSSGLSENLGGSDDNHDSRPACAGRRRRPGPSPRHHGAASGRRIPHRPGGRRTRSAGQAATASRRPDAAGHRAAWHERPRRVGARPRAPNRRPAW